MHERANDIFNLNQLREAGHPTQWAKQGHKLLPDEVSSSLLHCAGARVYIFVRLQVECLLQLSTLDLPEWADHRVIGAGPRFDRSRSRDRKRSRKAIADALERQDNVACAHRWLARQHRCFPRCQLALLRLCSKQEWCATPHEVRA